MKNNRSLFPPLFSEVPTGGGGGGSGNKIQLSELPEASLEYKDRIVQYTGETTEALTNGFFYKCVEHTVTEGDVITVTYSWDNIPVMEVESGGGSTVEYTVTADGVKTYKTLLSEMINAVTLTPNTKNYIICIGANRFFIQYATTTTLNYSGKTNIGSDTVDDTLTVSKDLFRWYRGGYVQDDNVPSNGTIITLYSI